MFFYALGGVVIAVIIMLSIYKMKGLAKPIKWILIAAVGMLMFAPAMTAMLATIL
jgi:hypothetical protein